MFFSEKAEPPNTRQECYCQATPGEHELETSDATNEQEQNKCRENVHAWGIKNRVLFDADKEHIIVMHPSDYHSESFKLLGCMVDLDLRMHTCIDQRLTKILFKSTAILRTRMYFGTANLLNQYKTNV